MSGVVGVNSPKFDPIFEHFYQAFKSSVSSDGSNAGIVILDFPERFRDAIFKRWVADTPPIDVGVPTIRRGKPLWRDGYNTATGAYWFALKSFLETVKGVDSDRIIALDASSDAVLFSLGDPTLQIDLNEVQKFSGLVVGYVQSGKTANYTAVAAKAFDAGFKLVIVLSGIHNSLRRQTQIRMNEELGLIQSTTERPTASSLLPPGAKRINTLTNEDLLSGDFLHSHISASSVLTQPTICVTKKNVAVLKRLRKWLGENVGVPVLIIDDEADQASVDSKAKSPEDFDPDRDPTEINKQIRLLLDSCLKYKAYVGYTATPYANVFINKDAFHNRLKNDLYPKDFIISLPKPSGYMGPEEFFGPNLTGVEGETTSISERVIEIVSEEERAQAISLKRDQSGNFVLPASLIKAVKEFILGTATKRRVDGKSSPSSFLAHTSHLQDDQNTLGSALEKLVMLLHQEWRYDRAKVQAEWETDWNILQSGMLGSDYQCDFEELAPHLDSLLAQYGNISVRILNFKSPDELDYEIEPNLCAIVVGGNKLSRGLTLEGLLVSYFLRNSSQPKADTLTQMGRFFGYRGHLVDITKVYTTDQLRSEFRDISYMESSLRKDIERYSRSGKTPEDFAPMVQKRAGLLPTAKMGAAKEYGITYSGDLIQTTSFEMGAEFHDANYKVTCDFLSGVVADHKLNNAVSPIISGSKYLWRSVDTNRVIKFIDNFKSVTGARRFNSANISRYIDDCINQISAEPELTNWNVALIGRTENPSLGSESFGLDLKVGRIMRSLDKGSKSSIGTLITPISSDLNKGDELIDFDEDMKKEALEYIKAGLPTGDAARSARDPKQGLLIVYPISPSEEPSEAENSTDQSLGQALQYDKTIVGLAFVFPNSNQDQTSRQFWKQ